MCLSVVVLGAIFMLSQVALATQWWLQARTAADNPWPEDMISGLDKNVAGLDDEDSDDDADASDEGDASAAVDAILASRGDEPRIRRPLSDVGKPSTDACRTVLRVGSSWKGGQKPEAVQSVLAQVFKDASGFWASSAEEISAVSKASGDGPPGPCAEATYGEIEVDGLHSVLTGLAQSPAAFDVFVDLGAGVGRTAAAALLLGLAAKAFAVELGPQRFALGCKAFAETNAFTSPPPESGDTHTAFLELYHGDARRWPEIAAKHDWPKCGPGWAFYLGAECFRDALMVDISRALIQGCSSGARLAVLGRRLPASAIRPHAGHGTNLYFRDIGAIKAKTTWSPGTDVHLYELSSIR